LSELRFENVWRPFEEHAPGRISRLAAKQPVKRFWVPLESLKGRQATILVTALYCTLIGGMDEKSNADWLDAGITWWLAHLFLSTSLGSSAGYLNLRH